MAKKVEKKKVGIFSKFCSRLLVCVLLLLVALISLKASPDLREFVYKNVFKDNFSFAKVNEIYEKLFGASLPLTSTDDTALVSAQTLEYSAKEDYMDGVKLTVSTNYVVPIINSGIVIFAGEKEGYGNTVIIQQADDVEVWYANLSDIRVSMYDYLKKGDILGEVQDDFLYLVFTKEGESLDYNKYI